MTRTDYEPGWWAVKLRYTARLSLVWHFRRWLNGEIVDYWDRCKFARADARRDLR